VCYSPHPFEVDDLTTLHSVIYFVPTMIPQSEAVRQYSFLDASLNYEIFFYLLFGISLLVRADIGRFSSRCLLWGLAVWDGGCSNVPGSGYLHEPQRSSVFDGMMLAVVFRAHGASSLTLGTILIAVGVLSGLVGVAGDLNRSARFVGLSPALVVAGTLALEPTLRRFRSSTVDSVSCCLKPSVLPEAFRTEMAELGGRLKSVVADGLRCVHLRFAIAGAIAVYYLIERPILVSCQSKRPNQTEAGASR
jgi:hypothetical protein